AGLDLAIHVFSIDLADAVHLREVERQAAVRRVEMALERGARAERDDGHAHLRAELHDAHNLVRGLRKSDGIRRLVFDPGQSVAVLLSQRLGLAEPVAEPACEICVQRAAVLCTCESRWREAAWDHHVLPML